VTIIKCGYVKSHNLLCFVFDTGALLFYGYDYLPGTDVLTYRFTHSLGFKSGEYKLAKTIACKYSKALGFGDIFEHFEKFQSDSRRVSRYHRKFVI
jgi:hypothetical protein